MHFAWSSSLWKQTSHPTFEKVFQTVTRKRAGALLVEAGAFMSAHQKQIIELALKHRLPTMYSNPRYVDAGGLMTYSGDRSEQYRRAADYVDKILKGTKPAELPVEQPKKFELVINLKTAKQIGLNIPQSVLYRADQVIKERRHKPEEVADERAAQGKT